MIDAMYIVAGDLLLRYQTYNYSGASTLRPSKIILRSTLYLDLELGYRPINLMTLYLRDWPHHPSTMFVAASVCNSWT